MADVQLNWIQGGIEVVAVDDNRAYKFWDAPGQNFWNLDPEKLSKLQGLTVKYLADIQAVGEEHAKEKAKGKK